jgi:hypothetical protein
MKTHAWDVSHSYPFSSFGDSLHAAHAGLELMIQPGWTCTLSPPAAASQVLELQTCTTTPRCIEPLSGVFTLYMLPLC